MHTSIAFDLWYPSQDHPKVEVSHGFMVVRTPRFAKLSDFEEVKGIRNTIRTYGSSSEARCLVGYICPQAWKWPRV